MHGLVSISDEKGYIFLQLVENAHFNKGKSKLYDGVASNLFAFACKMAFEAGYEGIVSFISKTTLIEHYQKTVEAKRLGGTRMYLDTEAAWKLVKKYFPDFK